MKKILKKIMIILQMVSPKLATKILFRKYIGKKLDLKNPQTLNEKMQWLKLNVYNDNELVYKCTDKYAVREFVKEKKLGEILVKLLGVWDNVEEIDWNRLPNKFVLKCNHGSGSVIICNDKKNFDIIDAKHKLTKWLQEDFGQQRAELSYKGIKKKIICEELIETNSGLAPNDYKIFCNYGVPKFLFVASNRNGEHAYFDYFDLNWNHYPVTNDHPNSPVTLKKPKNFDKMLSIASKLSKEFPLVRVDLYNENGKIYFGELTFLHFGGLHKFSPDDFDLLFGNLIDIDMNKYNKKN